MSNEVDELVDIIVGFEKKPLDFVLFAFDWDSPELKGKTIQKWQKELLLDIQNGLKTPQQAIQVATASGHGIGKSAFVAWLTLWALCTKINTKGIITANTETQLKTKTWAELAKWYRLLICKEWFEFTATAIYSKDEEYSKTWRIDMIAWSERNTEAFAGLHNQGNRILLIFDEASAIPDMIWEVSEGALTDKDTEIIWAVFGNPTRNSGRFKDCFFNLRHRWITRQIDSREVSFTNKETIANWIADYGEDSDWVKVRIKGDFPSQSYNQFISSDIVESARNRQTNITEYGFAPKILGVDPAWTGGDEICFYLRQGNYSKLLKVIEKNDDDFYIANLIYKMEQEYNIDKVFIDFGYGTGIYSAGKQLGRNWQLVQFGAKAINSRYANKRIEMWGAMKDWLRDGGCIENDKVLFNELVSPEYQVIATGGNAGKEILESKDDMKKRGLGSPNRADALALTFAYPVRSKIASDYLERAKKAQKKEYNVLKGWKK